MSGTALVATQATKRSLTIEMADQYGMEPARFLETIKATVFPTGANVTNEQLAAFLVVAKQYGLNPFIREIYAFPCRGSGIVPIVSVDGWTALINRQANFDGVEFEDHMKEGRLVAITCRIYRKDRGKPTAVTEHLNECQRDTEPWKKWPARMLRHKALIQCARYAFSLSGIFDEDEGDRMERPNGGLEVEADSPLRQLPAEIPKPAEIQRGDFKGVPFAPSLKPTPVSPEARLPFHEAGQKPQEIVSPRDPDGKAELFYQVGKDEAIVSGRTVLLKDDFPKLGAKWDSSARVWRMPAVRTHELVTLCEKKNIHAEEVHG